MDLASTTDVFVIGGGPSGLAAAIAARQKGFNVILADGAAPPIEKPCGEGMMPETITALRDLGVTIGPSDGVNFRGICFAQWDARVTGNFPSGLGVGMRRTALHERLVARAERCGVQLLWRRPVVAIGADFVEMASGRIPARWIIGADGQASRVRRWSGIATKQIRQRFATRRHFRVQPWSRYVEVHWSTHAQAYVTPVAPDEVCIVMISATARHASFDRALGGFPAIREKIAGAKTTSRERGACLVHAHVAQRAARKRCSGWRGSGGVMRSPAKASGWGCARLRRWRKRSSRETSHNMKARTARSPSVRRAWHT